MTIPHLDRKVRLRLPKKAAGDMFAVMRETVTCKFPHALLVRVDDVTDDRNAFICEAVAEKLARTNQNGKSAWDALSEIAGMEITIAKAPEKVKRIDL